MSTGRGFGASRRDFLSGLLAAGAAGAAWSLPGVTRATAPAAWSETDVLDVLVVGTGIAGLSAACAAKEAGAKKVLLIEKGPLIGGHSIYSSGSIAVVTPRTKP